MFLLASNLGRKSNNFHGKTVLLINSADKFIVTSRVLAVPVCLKVIKQPQKYYLPLLYSTALYFCTQQKLGSVTTQ
jgi:hypothetical protein